MNSAEGAVCFLRLRRRKSRTSARMSARSTKPPTTPPAMRPASEGFLASAFCGDREGAPDDVDTTNGEDMVNDEVNVKSLGVDITFVRFCDENGVGDVDSKGSGFDMLGAEVEEVASGLLESSVEMGAVFSGTEDPLDEETPVVSGGEVADIVEGVLLSARVSEEIGSVVLEGRFELVVDGWGGKLGRGNGLGDLGIPGLSREEGGWLMLGEACLISTASRSPSRR